MSLSAWEDEEGFPSWSRKRREDLWQELWEMLHALKAKAQTTGRADLLWRVEEHIKRLEIVRGNGHYPFASKSGERDRLPGSP